MYVPINPLGYSCIKKLQRDNLWHAYNEPINIYSVVSKTLQSESVKKLKRIEAENLVFFNNRNKILFIDHCGRYFHDSPTTDHSPDSHH